MRGHRVREAFVRFAGHGTAAAPPAGGPRRPLVVVSAAVLLTLTGCAGLDGAGSVATPGAGGDAADDAPGPEAPLLQIHAGGGFLPIGWDFARVPELTVYADGRAILHGPQIEIYPPPVLPNLLEVVLDDAEVDALVTAARDAGLLEEVTPEYGVPNVADAGATFVTLRVDGRTSALVAEALTVVDGIEGMEPAPGAEVPDPPGQTSESPTPENAALWGLTEAELVARAALASFLTQARELVGSVMESTPYAIDAFAVMARPAQTVPGDGDGDGAGDAAVEDGPSGTGPAIDDDLPPQVLTWPLRVALADADDCLVVDGEDAQVLRRALAGVGVTAQYEQAGVRYDAWFRPLLPHEDGCPS